MTLSASNPFLASTRWRAIVRATSGDYLGQCGMRLRSLWREFGVRIKPAESFYGSLAKTFLEMPTTLRQMLRRTFWRLRVLPQVLRRLLWRLRVLPQVSLRSPWRLRILPQVSRRLLWRLRVLPQVSRQMPGRLRESRKSAFLHFGAYKTVASISKGTLAVTTCYQRHYL